MFSVFNCRFVTYGQFMNCPYMTGTHNDDSMHMVRHHNKFINFCMRKMSRYVMPYILDNLPCIIQHHFPIRNISE